MRYRIAFAKRMQSEGLDSSMRPSVELDQNLAEGVVAEKVFIEEFESEAQHSQEVLDEDDAFLGSAAPEVWEYEVVDSRAAEFEEAIQNSDLVLEYDVVDTEVTLADDAAGVRTVEDSVYPADGGRDGNNSGSDVTNVTAGGSGVRAGDGGPAGMPTGDPSAGGLGEGGKTLEEVEPGSGGIDDLQVLKASDPRLGLTNRGQKPAQDWAADTGPTRNPDRSVEADDLLDEVSTLGPDQRKKRR